MDEIRTIKSQLSDIKAFLLPFSHSRQPSPVVSTQAQSPLRSNTSLSIVFFNTNSRISTILSTSYDCPHSSTVSSNFCLSTVFLNTDSRTSRSYNCTRDICNLLINKSPNIWLIRDLLTVCTSRTSYT